jgi:D-alanine transaminase
MNTVFLNSKYIKKSDATISIDDRGFNFGDGLYDVMLVCDYKIIDFDIHCNRIEKTAKRIGINLDYSRREIFEISTKLILQNDINEGRLMIVLSRGNSDRWLNDFSSVKQNFLIYCQKIDCDVGKNKLKSINLKLHEDIRWKFRDIKVTSLLPSVVARNEVEKLGFYDALYHENGFLNETSRANIFVVSGKKIITPPLSHKILGGITRFRLIELFNSKYFDCLSADEISFISGFSLYESDISIESCLGCDEVFITSATARVCSIYAVDDVSFKQNSVAKIMLKIYDNFCLNTTH